MAKKIFKGDKNHKALLSFFEKGKVKFDTEGVIGGNSAAKTKEYLDYYANSYDDAMNLAKRIISDPKQFRGHLEWHETIPNKVVAIYNYHVSVYIKCMTYKGYLYIDIHLHNEE